MSERALSALPDDTPVRVFVVGAGSWGTALATAASRRHPTELWARDSSQAAIMMAARENARYLPGVSLSTGLTISSDLDAVLALLVHNDAKPLIILGVLVAGLAATSPNVLTVPVDLDVTTLQDFVNLANEKDGAWNYGSIGAGSSAHLAMEMFKQQAQVSLAQIPYSSFPQIMTAIIDGDIQAGFTVLWWPQLPCCKCEAARSGPGRHQFAGQ